MSAIRSACRISRLQSSIGRPQLIWPVHHARHQSTYQSPTPQPPPEVNHHRSYYRSQGLPVFKAVLIAITTYELLYWSWLYLESVEEKADKNGEVRDLQQELKSLVQEKSSSG